MTGRRDVIWIVVVWGLAMVIAVLVIVYGRPT